LKAQGVDEVIGICVAAIEDVYGMVEVWGIGGDGAGSIVNFFADPKGELTLALGLNIEQVLKTTTKKFMAYFEDGVLRFMSLARTRSEYGEDLFAFGDSDSTSAKKFLQDLVAHRRGEAVQDHGKETEGGEGDITQNGWGSSPEM